MSKKTFGPGRCVHCLMEVEERSSDHVFPESWYPDSTPPNVGKWQIPSCNQCNSDYGKLEQDFLIRVGLCLDPHDPASASVVQKALRSVKPAAAHNPHDARHRLGRGQRILAQALQGEQIPDLVVFPGLGDRWPGIPGERTAICVPKKSFERITEKIVRGIYYIEDGTYIAPPYAIEFFALPKGGTTDWTDLLNRWGEIYAREPGIVVRRAVTPEDGVSALFEITFWKQFETYATVTKHD